METTKVSDYIARRKSADPEFDRAFKEESRRLEVANALRELRKAEGLTQRQLADRVNKPQSTIARIENGSINVTFNTMKEIANALNKEIEIRFI